MARDGGLRLGKHLAQEQQLQLVASLLVVGNTVKLRETLDKMYAR